MEENDTISNMNVYSKTYNCPFADMEIAFMDFTEK